MMEFLAEYGMFLLKAITIVVAIIVVFGMGFALARRDKGRKEHLEINKLNKKYADMAKALERELMPKSVWKQKLKLDKKQTKAEEKQAAKTKEKGKDRIFVLEFEGDIRASAVSSLREEITAVLAVAEKKDTVLLKLESSGGTVHGYGLASSQLSRLIERKIKLVVAVDKIAASGGYMMACVADKLIAAPFAIIGSIGVVAQLPNFNRLLKKHSVDFEQITAGEYKRTLTVFGQNTAKGRQKFKQQIEDIHGLFKQHVAQHRPTINMKKVATGEYWYATDAIKLSLVDELMTSDDYLFSQREKYDIYELSYKAKQNLPERIASAAQLAIKRSIETIWQSGDETRFQ